MGTSAVAPGHRSVKVAIATPRSPEQMNFTDSFNPLTASSIVVGTRRWFTIPDGEDAFDPLRHIQHGPRQDAMGDASFRDLSFFKGV